MLLANCLLTQCMSTKCLSTKCLSIKLSVNQNICLSVDQMSIKMPDDEVSVDQFPVIQMSVHLMSVLTTCQPKVHWTNCLPNRYLLTKCLLMKHLCQKCLSAKCLLTKCVCDKCLLAQLQLTKCLLTKCLLTKHKSTNACQPNVCLIVWWSRCLSVKCLSTKICRTIYWFDWKQEIQTGDLRQLSRWPYLHASAYPRGNFALFNQWQIAWKKDLRWTLCLARKNWGNLKAPRHTS